VLSSLCWLTAIATIVVVADDRQRFEQEEEWLCQGLLRIREQILKNDEIRNRIIEKYKIKNVTGYSMNAFVDFEHPMDIFAHLLIGGEGTLGFIVSAELNTLPLMLCIVRRCFISRMLRKRRLLQLSSEKVGRYR